MMNLILEFSVSRFVNLYWVLIVLGSTQLSEPVNMNLIILVPFGLKELPHCGKKLTDLLD
jgi:hypothetical protein